MQDDTEMAHDPATSTMVVESLLDYLMERINVRASIAVFTKTLQETVIPVDHASLVAQNWDCIPHRSPTDTE
jgi:hypothetical protein